MSGNTGTSFERLTPLASDADEALVWAVQYEHALRQRSMHFARVGLAGVLRETTLAIKRLNDVYNGDPLLQ